MGTAQLLRSYNDKRGMLVVTGITSKDVYLASTQINQRPLLNMVAMQLWWIMIIIFIIIVSRRKLI